VFLGRDYGHQANYSDEVAAHIDAEIRVLIEDAHSEARAILNTHRAVLDELASALVEKETLDTAELAQIMGHLSPWAGRHAKTNGKSNGSRAGAGRVRSAPPVRAGEPAKATDPPAARRRPRSTPPKG
jgi:cell division protease FtsH